MIPYIQLENITKSFGDLVLYDSLSMTVGQGQRVALVARNGAGKTTLLRIITGMESADSGTVTFRGDIRVGYLEQQPRFDPSHTVIQAAYAGGAETAQIARRYEELAAGGQEIPAELLHLMDTHGGWDFESKAKAILDQLKITDMDQPVAQLSGGQRKRVALANLLIGDPDVLILDEPTNHLDLEMAEWLEEHLAKSNRTILMVTHDRYFLDRVCTDIYEIDQKRLYTYTGGYSDYIEKKQERIELFNAGQDKARNLYARELEWMRRMPSARGTKAKYRKDAFGQLQQQVARRRDDAAVKIDVASSRLGKKILEITDLSKRFGDKVITDRFSFTFARYQKLGIIGDNGTGKTTFLNMITGAVAPDGGVISPGETIRFGYYRQQEMEFDESMKVIDVARGIAETVATSGGQTVGVSQFLNQFLFPPEVQHNFVSKLSGGEKRRLYLLTVLMRSPNFLILDEPTNDLDIMTLNVLEEYLEHFDGCVIVVSHDRYFMDKVVDQLMVFGGGGKIRTFPGNYTLYREKQRNEEASVAAKAPVALPDRDTRPVARPAKLSYKQQQLVARLEAEIAALEAEKASLEKELESGMLSPNELTTNSVRIGEVMALLSEREMEWLEASENA